MEQNNGLGGKGQMSRLIRLPHSVVDEKIARRFQRSFENRLISRQELKRRYPDCFLDSDSDFDSDYNNPAARFGADISALGKNEEEDELVVACSCSPKEIEAIKAIATKMAEKKMCEDGVRLLPNSRLRAITKVRKPIDRGYLATVGEEDEDEDEEEDKSENNEKMKKKEEKKNDHKETEVAVVDEEVNKIEEKPKLSKNFLSRDYELSQEQLDWLEEKSCRKNGAKVHTQGREEYQRGIAAFQKWDKNRRAKRQDTSQFTYRYYDFSNDSMLKKK